MYSRKTPSTSWRSVSSLGLTSLLMMMIIAPTGASDDIGWDNLEMEEVESWDDPLGDGSGLLLDVSPNGSMLAFAGLGLDGSIIITDRDMDPIADLGRFFVEVTLKGVRWSSTGKWLAVWGDDEAGDSDVLHFFDTTSWELASNFTLNGTIAFTTILAVQFLAGDHIVAISGLEDLGASWVTLCEPSTGILLQNYSWDDGVRVLFLTDDLRTLVCIDETGAVTTIGGGAWEVVTRHEGRDAMPTAHANYPPRNKEWLVADEDGWFRFYGGQYHEDVADFEVSTEGAVQGIAWAFDERANYHVVASPRADGGSTITGYFIANDRLNHGKATRDPIKTDIGVTSLLTDGSADGLIWATFADGSVALYSARPIPDAHPEVTITVPVGGEAYSKPFIARGNVSDDHDRIEYVRVQVDEGNWFDANVSDGEWTYRVGPNFLDEGNHVLVVEVFDGRNRTSTSEGYQVLPDDDDFPDRWKYIVLNMVLIPIIVIVIFLWVRRRRGQGNDQV